ncbi:MAG TPA: Amuc_1100 family pilus-like protein [Chthoniobacterales bacterium]
MTWFRENRLLGAFLVLFGVGTLGAFWFLWSAKSDRVEAWSRLNNTAKELDRLERLSPYPNAENLRQMKAHAESYSDALAKLKDELKERVAPVEPLKPNEFQSRLRVAVAASSDKARANKVKLPDKFYLGFDEYAAALPTSEESAKLLGQELAQIEWLLNSLLEARVEAVTAFRRSALRGERAPPGANPAGTLPTGANPFERNVVETTFFSTPDAARKVINQIAGADQHFCIIRLLHVRNEKEKGPPREVASEASGVASAPPTVPAGSPGARPSPGPAFSFIVGNERIETTAKIEIVRFTF